MSSGAEEEQVCRQQKRILSLRGRYHTCTAQSHCCCDISGASPGSTSHPTALLSRVCLLVLWHQVSSTMGILATVHKWPKSPITKYNFGKWGKRGWAGKLWKIKGKHYLWAGFVPIVFVHRTGTYGNTTLSAQVPAAGHSINMLPWQTEWALQRPHLWGENEHNWASVQLWSFFSLAQDTKSCHVILILPRPNETGVVTCSVLHQPFSSSGDHQEDVPSHGSAPESSPSTPFLWTDSL